jgi:hypothetical protein
MRLPDLLAPIFRVAFLIWATALWVEIQFCEFVRVCTVKYAVDSLANVGVDAPLPPPQQLYGHVKGGGSSALLDRFLAPPSPRLVVSEGHPTFSASSTTICSYSSRNRHAESLYVHFR